MKIHSLSNQTDKKKLIDSFGADEGGKAILQAKTECELIVIKQLHVGGANILKQDALSLGADVAVPRGTVLGEPKRVDCLLIANKRQLFKLAKKLLAQPFGLKEVGVYLQKVVHVKKHRVKVMGIINANDDSFYAQSRFLANDAVEKIEQMIAQGAEIIDIGGVSSRPNAPKVHKQEELRRLRPIVDAIYKNRLYEQAEFSIDSYTPEVISYVLERGFGIINDITGLRDDEVCRLCASYNAKAVIMHMQGTPQNMQNNPTYEDVVEEVYDFFVTQLQKAKDFGIQEVVLDVGIGFGKTLKHNLLLLQHLKHFQTLNAPLLVGASRKSLIDAITPSATQERLGGSLALHLRAVQEGAEIIRVHDVYEHYQALRVIEALEEYTL